MFILWLIFFVLMFFLVWMIEVLSLSEDVGCLFVAVSRWECAYDVITTARRMNEIEYYS